MGSLPGGSTTALLGALVLAATALGLGWVNAGADYSRYLPRSVSSRAVVGWTTLGASLAPVDPIGALTSVLPTWYLVPFAFVAVFGLVAGAVLDIYSSGLTLLTLGLRVARWKAALVDGLLMVAGTVWIVFFATDVIGPFQGFLITLGVPITAWCGVFVADLALRRRPYAQTDLYDSAGRYGAFGTSALASMAVATVVGWGLVVNTNSSALAWQGFLLDPLGLGPKLEGPWTYANLGVLAALVIGFVGHWAFGRGRVRVQERALG